MKRRDARTHQYLIKRILVQAARAGIKQAAAETIAIMGYNVIVENGWVVKKYADGRVEQITPFSPVEKREIILD